VHGILAALPRLLIAYIHKKNVFILVKPVLPAQACCKYEMPVQHKTSYTLHFRIRSHTDSQDGSAQKGLTIGFNYFICAKLAEKTA
jgi:hypothetical protein